MTTLTTWITWITLITWSVAKRRSCFVFEPGFNHTEQTNILRHTAVPPSRQHSSQTSRCCGQDTSGPLPKSRRRIQLVLEGMDVCRCPEASMVPSACLLGIQSTHISMVMRVRGDVSSLGPERAAWMASRAVATVVRGLRYRLRRPRRNTQTPSVSPMNGWLVWKLR